MVLVEENVSISRLSISKILSCDFEMTEAQKRSDIKDIKDTIKYTKECRLKRLEKHNLETLGFLEGT